MKSFLMKLKKIFLQTMNKYKLKLFGIGFVAVAIGSMAMFGSWKLKESGREDIKKQILEATQACYDRGGIISIYENENKKMIFDCNEMNIRMRLPENCRPEGIDFNGEHYDLPSIMEKSPMEGVPEKTI